MRATAVLINEFGEVGLDHLLVRKVDENIVLLNSGCLCCTVRDDLVETLDDLQGKRNASTLLEFDRVIIETTGLADPAPIIHTLLTNTDLIPHYRLMGLVATLDAVHGNGQLDEHSEAAKQVAMADRIVITKAELANPETLGRLRDRLSHLSPSAAIFEATLHSGPGPDALFNSRGFSADGKTADVKRWLLGKSSLATSRQHSHALDVNRHDHRISTFCVTADAPLDWTVLTQWLALLLANRGEQLLRVKGILNVAGRSRPVIIQGVQHVFYPPTELDAWPDADHRSRIVFIARDLPGSAVERSFRSSVARH